jgi:hypothetical protein
LALWQTLVAKINVWSRATAALAGGE